MSKTKKNSTLFLKNFNNTTLITSGISSNSRPHLQIRKTLGKHGPNSHLLNRSGIFGAKKLESTIGNKYYSGDTIYTGEDITYVIAAHGMVDPSKEFTPLPKNVKVYSPLTCLGQQLTSSDLKDDIFYSCPGKKNFSKQFVLTNYKTIPEVGFWPQFYPGEFSNNKSFGAGVYKCFRLNRFNLSPVIVIDKVMFLSNIIDKLIEIHPNKNKTINIILMSCLKFSEVGTSVYKEAKGFKMKQRPFNSTGERVNLNEFIENITKYGFVNEKMKKHYMKNIVTSDTFQKFGSESHDNKNLIQLRQGMGRKTQKSKKQKKGKKKSKKKKKNKKK